MIAPGDLVKFDDVSLALMWSNPGTGSRLAGTLTVLGACVALVIYVGPEIDCPTKKNRRVLICVQGSFGWVWYDWLGRL